MTIVVGSDLPGLLGALEQALGGSRRLTIVRETAAVLEMMNTDMRVDALILDDGMVPLPGKDIAASLWEIIAFVTNARRPCVPIAVTLDSETPAAIHQALRDATQQTGGALFLLSRTIRTANQPEARQTVAHIIEQLALDAQRRQYLIAAVNNASGVGQTTTMMHMGVQLVRLGLRVLLVNVDDTPTEATEQKHGVITTAPSCSASDIAQRIVHHVGLDTLALPAVFAESKHVVERYLEPLEYDVFCFDFPRNWHRHPLAQALFARPNTTPVVVCSPGTKERAGATAALAALSAIAGGDERMALDATMLIFIEGERGLVRNIDQIRQEVRQNYPSVTELGVLPRDPALLSTAAEQPEVGSIFELAPQRRYCQIIRHVARTWVAAAGVPTTWLTRYDRDERCLLQFLWPFRIHRKIKAGRMARPAPQPNIEPVSASTLADVRIDEAAAIVFDEPISTSTLADVHVDEAVAIPSIEESAPDEAASIGSIEESAPEESVPMGEGAPLGAATWLDEALHHNRVRVRRGAAAFDHRE